MSTSENRRTRLLLVGIDPQVKPNLLRDADTLTLPDWTTASRSRELIEAFSPDAVLCGAALFEEQIAAGCPPKSEAPALSARQSQVLWALRAGLRNREISEQIGVSTRTIKNYMSELFATFDVTNRTELLSAAIDSRVFESSDEKQDTPPHRAKLIA